MWAIAPWRCVSVALSSSIAYPSYVGYSSMALCECRILNFDSSSSNLNNSVALFGCCTLYLDSSEVVLFGSRCEPILREPAGHVRFLPVLHVEDLLDRHHAAYHGGKLCLQPRRQHLLDSLGMTA